MIKKFSAKNKNCFRYKDVIAEFPDKDRSHLSKVLASMVSMGMLMKLYRDLYCIIPLSTNPETFSPDSRLVARCIMKGKGYYIAYSSAIYHSRERTDLQKLFDYLARNGSHAANILAR